MDNTNELEWLRNYKETVIQLTDNLEQMLNEISRKSKYIYGQRYITEDEAYYIVGDYLNNMYYELDELNKQYKEMTK